MTFYRKILEKNACFCSPTLRRWWLVQNLAVGAQGEPLCRTVPPGDGRGPGRLGAGRAWGANCSDYGARSFRVPRSSSAIAPLVGKACASRDGIATGLSGLQRGRSYARGLCSSDSSHHSSPFSSSRVVQCGSSSYSSFALYKSDPDEVRLP